VRQLTGEIIITCAAAVRNSITVFSVRGPCREDMREYGNGN
jgi:hypothetical protein